MSEQEAIREVFDRFDSDSNGMIDFYEFDQLCKTLDKRMTDEAIAGGFDSADSDADGVIDWSEFIAWWRQMTG